MVIEEFTQSLLTTKAGTFNTLPDMIINLAIALVQKTIEQSQFTLIADRHQQSTLQSTSTI